LFNEDGQAMVEFALVAPIFILIFLVGTLQFGIIINYENGVLASAREGARWGSITGDADGDGSREDDIREVVNDKVDKYIEMMGWDKSKTSINVSFDETLGDSSTELDGGDPIIVNVNYEMELFFPWPDVFTNGNTLNIEHEVTTVLESV